MENFIEYTDRGDNYKKPKRHTENEVHDIRIYCEHPKCKQYIKGKEGYNGSFTAETGHRMDLRNDVFICDFHAHLYGHLKKAVIENKVCNLHIEDFKNCVLWQKGKGGCTPCKYYVKENENTMKLKHTLKEIIKNTEAIMTYVCEGKVYYEIVVYSTTEKPSGVYQLEIDSNNDEWKATYIYPRFKAITLMRWIRKGFEDGKLIQIK
jgi:hypothetical protein